MLHRNNHESFSIQNEILLLWLSYRGMRQYSSKACYFIKTVDANKDEKNEHDIPRIPNLVLNIISFLLKGGTMID